LPVVGALVIFPFSCRVSGRTVLAGGGGRKGSGAAFT
jgi:hypothetical protein